MPIKLKRTNIQYDIDPPENGYVILGFDESGNLVTKNDQGVYEPIINEISTGSFVRLEVNYLTVGNRISGVAEGLYSIGQGLNISASGDTAFAQGSNATASAVYSFARGEFVEATGTLSYVSCQGSSTLNKLTSSGVNSFVHMVSTGVASGALADYSAILGGRNHNIGTSSTDSAILGGTSNNVNSLVTGTVILGGTNQTATQSNTVYLPRMILKNSPALTSDGGIYYDGSNFYGYSGGIKQFDLSLTSGGANRVSYTTADGNLTSSANLTFNGSTMSLTGSLTTSGTLTSNGTLVSNGAFNINGSSASIYNTTETDRRLTLTTSTTYGLIYFYDEGSTTFYDTKIGSSAINQGIYYDASTYRVGINDSSPTYTLDVNGDISGTRVYSRYGDMELESTSSSATVNPTKNSIVRYSVVTPTIGSGWIRYFDLDNFESGSDAFETTFIIEVSATNSGYLRFRDSNNVDLISQILVSNGNSVAVKFIWCPSEYGDGWWHISTQTSSYTNTP